jgi:hypothetical protein
MAQAMGIRDWQCGTHKPAGGESCHDKDRKPESETKEKGEEWENKPNRINMLFINNIRQRGEKQTQR